MLWWNEKLVEKFIKNRPDEHWEMRAIPLSDLGCKHPENLTVDQLVELLDYIGVLQYDDFDLDDFEFDIKIKFDSDAYYLLEMKWR